MKQCIATVMVKATPPSWNDIGYA